MLLQTSSAVFLFLARLKSSSQLTKSWPKTDIKARIVSPSAKPMYFQSREVSLLIPCFFLTGLDLLDFFNCFLLLAMAQKYIYRSIYQFRIYIIYSNFTSYG